MQMIHIWLEVVTLVYNDKPGIAKKGNWYQVRFGALHM